MVGCFKYHDNDDGDDDEDEFQNKKTTRKRVLDRGFFYLYNFPHIIEKVVFVLVISRLLTSAGP